MSENDKRYMWRCRGHCRNQPPYFGFIWVKEDRQPHPTDLMWIHGECDTHEFERFGEFEHPKQWLTDWECITMFNKFVTMKRIRIKSAQIHVTNFNSEVGTFVIESNGEEVIPDELYVNYDEETRSFISIEQFLPDLYETRNENCTVCMICYRGVAKGNVIEHLDACSGLEFSLGSKETLPILNVSKSSE